MTLVTISKDTTGCGRELAELLSARLGYRCYSRENILQMCAEFNIPEDLLKKAMDEVPSILDWFRYGKERYFSWFRSVFLNNMVSDNVVYHGLAGQFYLQDISHACKIRIITAMDDRIEQRMDQTGCDRRQARIQLEKEDDLQRRWSLGLYGFDVTNPKHFDITLRVSVATIEDCLDVLCCLVEQNRFKATAHSSAKLLEMALMAGIHADLVDLAPKIAVNYESGMVSVHNYEGSDLDHIEKKEDIVKELKGKYGLTDVVFGGPVRTRKTSPMQFYNLSVA